MAEASHDNKTTPQGAPKGGLEIGRQGAAAAATGGTRKTATGTAPPPPQIAGEKAVRPTKATVGVDPLDTDARDGDLLPDPALDRRREIVGTDDPKGKTGKP